MATKAVVEQSIEDSNVDFPKLTSPQAKALLKSMLNATNALTATATLNFVSTAAQTSSDLTIALTGATVGMTVKLGTPAAPDADSAFTAFVSATNVVTVRFHNYSAAPIDPASGSYKVIVE